MICCNSSGNTAPDLSKNLTNEKNTFFKFSSVLKLSTFTAVETIMKKGSVNEIYNIGTDNEFNVIEILQKLVFSIKKDPDYLKYAEFVEDRLFNDFRYCVDSSKLRDLGWRETISFSEGLKETIEWYCQEENREMFHFNKDY